MIFVAMLFHSVLILVYMKVGRTGRSIRECKKRLGRGGHIFCMPNINTLCHQQRVIAVEKEHEHCYLMRPGLHMFWHASGKPADGRRGFPRPFPGSLRECLLQQ